MSVLRASIALTQFPSGLLSDELGYRTALVPALAVAGVSTAALAWIGVLPAFLVLVVFVGVGTEAFPTVARALLSSRFGEERGRAFGVFGGAGDAAGVATPFAATAAIAAGVWWATFLVVGARGRPRGCRLPPPARRRGGVPPVLSPRRPRAGRPGSGRRGRGGRGVRRRIDDVPAGQAGVPDGWFEGASEGGAFGLARLIYATIASVGSTVSGSAARRWGTT